jgi:NAD(P)-dependent dehydrogenase (short-subunit alcohol dehydrogenase family)
MDIKPNLKDQIIGKTIIITGCSYGLGSSLAKSFGDNGASVIGIDKSEPENQHGVIESRFTFYKADISREAEVADCFHNIFQQFGIPQLLINRLLKNQGKDVDMLDAMRIVV